jgi:hypothetical protein
MDICYASSFIEFCLAQVEWNVDLVLLITYIVFTNFDFSLSEYNYYFSQREGCSNNCSDFLRPLRNSLNLIWRAKQIGQIR